MAVQREKNDPGIRYQYVPSGAERCGNCQMFRKPCHCTDVKGVISDNGWCKIHASKLGTQRHGG